MVRFQRCCYLRGLKLEDTTESQMKRELRPLKWLSDMDKNVKLGKYDPISLGMWLSKLLLEISNSDKF